MRSDSSRRMWASRVCVDGDGSSGADGGVTIETEMATISRTVLFFIGFLKLISISH